MAWVGLATGMRTSGQWFAYLVWKCVSGIEMQVNLPQRLWGVAPLRETNEDLKSCMDYSEIPFCMKFGCSARVFESIRHSAAQNQQVFSKL